MTEDKPSTKAIVGSDAEERFGQSTAVLGNSEAVQVLFVVTAKGKKQQFHFG